MKDFTKIFFSVAQIVTLILGILFSITIVGLILGVPLFIASSNYKKFGQLPDNELIQAKSSILGWNIFTSIVLAPSVLGFIVMLIFALMINNYINDLASGSENANKSFGDTLKDGTKNVISGTVNSTKEIFNIKSNSAKLKEELEELKKLFDEGVITEEEYNQLRSNVISKLNK